MIKDLNKGINSITYNFLNLPVKITSYKGTIEYIYDASGNKMQKLVTQAGKSIATLYLGGFQYENNLLQFFPQAEGYVKNNAGKFQYVYNYTDHLGNIRISYIQENGILQDP